MKNIKTKSNKKLTWERSLEWNVTLDYFYVIRTKAAQYALESRHFDDEDHT